MIQRKAVRLPSAHHGRWPEKARCAKKQIELPTNAKILVVAPDPDFRRSLAFVLEAEGCRVNILERLPDLDTLSDRYDCLVIDHRSIPAAAQSGTLLASMRTPMVVLVSDAQDMVARGFERVVVKPFLGHKLVEAVRDALKQEPQRVMPT